MLDLLKRQLISIRTLALNIYDNLDAGETATGRLAATIDNRRERENPVRLDQDFFFPEIYGWEDELITVEGLDKIDFVVPMKGYDAAIPYNRVNIGRPETVARLERAVPRIAVAFQRMQQRRVMEVFRKNPLSYDGQNFFDTDHAHPSDKGTYSNVLALGFTDPAAPTVDEAKELLDAARSRFATNLTIESEVIDAARLDDNLLVIVHNATHFSTFNKVRTKPRFELEENEHQGTFTLLQDQRPTSGQENSIEIVFTEPNGPRPAFLVLDQDPMLDTWESDRFGNEYVAVGMKGIFGVKPGYPQTSLQAQE